MKACVLEVPTYPIYLHYLFHVLSDKQCQLQKEDSIWVLREGPMELYVL